MTFKCKFGGLVLPLFGESEMDWPNPLRLILYLMGLGWTFLGVAVISDVFMAGIEKVTSAKRRVTNKETGRTVTVYVWNATVANLTLMALGSSAPEILLSVIEITTGKFMLGALGAGTIVGSAAFNLLIISAVCVMAIPEPEIRYIKEVPVYIVTATCSVAAYLWLMFILMVTSPDVTEIWEAVLTLLFCPILVLVAYIADRGYCSRRNAEDAEGPANHQALPDNISEEELAQIEKDIRADHGATLSSDQVIKIMQAQYFSHRSRAYYRHAAMEANLHGKRHSIHAVPPPDLTISEAVGTVDTIEQEKKQNQCEIGFACEKYAFAESIGNAKVVILRTGAMNCRCSVNYVTREGTAKEESDYVPVKGTLIFAKDEGSKTVEVVIKDDVAFELDEEFYIDLSDPQCLEPEPSVLGEERKPSKEGDKKAEKFTAVLSVPIVTVVIIDDDLPGDLRMKAEEVEVFEGDGDIEVEVFVERFNGATGKIKCEYRTDNMTAVDGVDYAGAKGVVEFDTNVVSQTIPVTIRPRGVLKERTFNLVIHAADGCNFDSKTDGGEEECICHVTIKPRPTGGDSPSRKNLLKDMKSRMISANAIMGSKNWAQQFKDALFDVGAEEDEDGDEDAPKGGPSILDYFIHVVAIPWKLLFAFVPPVDYCGGWACFCGALFMIAIVTALVGDMANLVGCCFDILPETAAITFVALGTSLPDTFASKTAAMMDPYADASIGNITGSNSINVFMGIGLAWCLAAFRWETSEPDEDWKKALTFLTPDQLANVRSAVKGNNAVFVTPAGTIWFNLMVFSVNAFFALQHLYQRRRKFGGELGGPNKGMFGQYFSAAFLIGQWFIYVTASIIFARTGDSALSYGQIAERG